VTHRAAPSFSLESNALDADIRKLADKAFEVYGTDTSVYVAAPPASDEFSGDSDPIAWEAVGWEEFFGSGGRTAEDGYVHSKFASDGRLGLFGRQPDILDHV
jgi:hypothetical protein